MNKMKKLLSSLLALSMVLSYVPVPGFAEEVCTHHAHDKACGYVEAVEGKSCTHQCTESCPKKDVTVCVHDHVKLGCAHTPAVEGVACDHVHGEGCGYVPAQAAVPCTCGAVAAHTAQCASLVTEGAECDCGMPTLHAEGCEPKPAVAEQCSHVHGACAYKAAVQESWGCGHICTKDSGCVKAVCAHAHDDSCGYVQAVKGSDCTFVCTECKAEEKSCTCESTDPGEHAPFCDLYVRTYEECKCVLDCAVEGLNDWCETCYFEGVEACGASGEEEDALFAVTEGDCGTGVRYAFDDVTGVLTISGNGAIAKMANATKYPWYTKRSSITKIVIESGVTTIPQFAFNTSSANSVIIPDTVTEIGKSAFYGNANLTSISIPSSVTTIGDTAFKNCSNLEPVYTNCNETEWNAKLGKNAFQGTSPEFVYDSPPVTVNYTVTVNVSGNGTVSGDGTYPEGDEVTVIATPDTNYKFVHWTENGTSVSTTKIYQFTLTGDRSLTAVFEEFTPNSGACGTDVYYTFDEATGVLTISGTGAMKHYNQGEAPWYDLRAQIKSVVIENGITIVSQFGFYECDQLTDVTIPDSVTSFGTGAFSDCDALTSFTIPPQVKSMGQGVFTGCSSLTNVTISEGVETIPANTFSSTPLTSITIPASVKNIGLYAFYHCEKLTTVNYDGLEDPVMINEPYNKEEAKKVFQECNISGITVNVPAGYQDAYFCGLDVAKRGYSIAVSASPAEGGTVTGGGSYAEGATVTLTAIAHSGYTFVNWTENGNAVSTNGMYTVEVSGDRDLVAVFEKNSAAQINKVTIFVDGVSYTEGEVFITCDSNIIFTVEGINFDMLDAEKNKLGFRGLGIGIDDYYNSWVIDTVANTATMDFTSWIANFETCDKNEVWYTNDSSDTICGTGIFLTYTVPAHTHNWTYASEGATITAACTAANCPNTDGGSVTISASNATYDGTAKAASLTADSIGGIGELSVAYEGLSSAPVNAGTYTASLTVDGKTISVTYTIAKKGMSIKADDQTIPYGGTLDNTKITNTGLIDGHSVTVTLTPSITAVGTGEITPSAAVIKAGDVDVTANYEITYENGALTITKASTSIAFNGYAPGKTYDGQPLANPTAEQLTITGAEYKDVTFTWYAGSVAEENKLTSAPSDAGTYYVVASIAEAANTTASSATSETITIDKLDISGAAITLGTALTYTGEEQTQTVAKVEKNGLEVTYTVEGNTGTEVKNDYILTVTGTGNFTGNATTTWSIGKAAPSYTVPTGLTATYGQTLANVTLPTGWAWKDGSASVGNAGTRTFKALYNPDSNNYNTVEADVTIEVAKALIDIYTDNLINPEFAEGLIYNGTAQALVTNSGSIDGGYIVFSLNPDGEYTTEIPVATEAGEYVVYYRIEGDENHYWEGSSAFEAVTIAKANPEYTVPTGLTATYGDTLANVVLPDGWTWKDAETTFVGNAGTGTFKALYNPDSNNYNTVEADVTIEVAKADPEYTVPTGLTATYGNTLADVELPAGWTWKDAETTSVGNAGTNTFQAIFTPADTTNYTVVESGVTITVAKATASVETAPADNTLTYTGEAQALVTAGTANGGEMQYSTDNQTWSTTIPAGTNAGDYTVYYKVVGDANYADTAVQSVAVTIAKAKAEITVDTDPITVTYGDSVELPEATSNFGTVTCDKAASDLVNAGTYTVTYSVAGTDNYDGDTKTVTVTVNPKSVTVKANAVSKTYGEADPELTYTATGLVDKDKLSGSLNREEGDNVGTYAIAQGTLTAGDNYTITYTGANLTINAKTITADDVKLNGSLVYTGSEQTQAVNVTDGITYEISDNKATNVGTYELTVKGTGNYTGEVKLSWSIDKSAATVETAPTVKTLTYTGEAQALVTAGTANGGEMQYSTDNQTWSTTIPSGTNAGEYTVYYKVAGDANHTDTDVQSVVVNIAKAAYDMTGAKWNYTDAIQYDGKQHTVEVIGLPAGVTVSGYTGNNAERVGEYTAKVTFSYDTVNYEAPALADLTWTIINDWTPTEYTVTHANSEGWLNEDFTLTAQDGYLISSANSADGEWKAALTFSADTDNGSVTFYLKNTKTGAISLEKTETYKIDKTLATGKITIGELTGWEAFVNSISFNLFFKDMQTVTITSADTGSGVQSVEYYASATAMTLEEVEAVTDWSSYNGGVNVPLEDAKKFVYFAKITDKAGNVTYLSTDGAVYDTAAPVIGIEPGTYYTTQTVTVTEANLDTLTLNGKAVTSPITLDGDKDTTYTIVAKDKAGHQVTVTVTMKTIASLDDSIGDLNENNVTSADREDIQDVLDGVNELLEDQNLPQAEKDRLEDIKEEAEGLLDTIDAAADAVDTEDIQKVEDKNSSNVKPEDKKDLEKAKEDLEDALKEENKGNYTEAEQKEIQKELDRINAALATVEQTEAVEAAIDALPKSVEPDLDEKTEKAIRDAKAAYDKLNDHQKSLISKTHKEKLEKLFDTLDDYKIIKGSGKKWEKGSGKSLTFTANGPDRKFKELRIDGYVVDTSNYTHKDGSTIITLKASYLQNLSTGKHTIQAVYTDGATDGKDTFRICNSGSNPATGDDMNMMLPGGIMITSLFCLAMMAMFIRRKKDRYER